MLRLLLRAGGLLVRALVTLVALRARLELAARLGAGCALLVACRMLSAWLRCARELLRGCVAAGLLRARAGSELRCGACSLLVLALRATDAAFSGWLVCCWRAANGWRRKQVLEN